jgi:[calcium/calmodulin-dependent protein kinase] kinase
MKAISKFKGLLPPKDSRSQMSLTPTADGASTPRGPSGPSIRDLQGQYRLTNTKSTDEHVEEVLRQRQQFRSSTEPPHTRGHAHDPTDTEPLLLGIGAGGHDDFGHAKRASDIVSDSPTAVDYNVYDRAFEAEVDRIKRSSSRRKPSGAMFLTRFVKQREQYKEDKAVADAPNRTEAGKGHNLADVVGQAAQELVKGSG